MLTCVVLSAARAAVAQAATAVVDARRASFSPAIAASPVVTAEDGPDVSPVDMGMALPPMAAMAPMAAPNEETAPEAAFMAASAPETAPMAASAPEVAALAGPNTMAAPAPAPGVTPSTCMS